MVLHYNCGCDWVIVFDILNGKKRLLVIINLPSLVMCTRSFNGKRLCGQTQIRFNYSSPMTTSLSLSCDMNSSVDVRTSKNQDILYNQNQTANTYRQINNKHSNLHNLTQTDKQNHPRSQKQKPCSVLMKCKSSQSLLQFREIQLHNRLSDLTNSAVVDLTNSQQHLHTSQNKQQCITTQLNQHKHQPNQSSKLQHFSFANLRPNLRKCKHQISDTSIEDFQIGPVMGKGSFGKVYRARHRPTGFFFALKQIKKSNIKDVGQFIMGIKGHFFLDHPNLAKLYYCFTNQEYFYLVMELCIDGSLQRYKLKIRSNDERDRIFLGIAQGLQYMHSCCLRHGDLKLQNILISNGFPKITDFDCIFIGKQKQFEQVRRKSKLWGSPAYFSPDMMKENTFALTDDIWSLGVIMYELYCNSHPFDLHDASDLAKIVSQQMIPIPKSVKASAKTMIERMLDKKKQTRITLQQILQYH